MNHKNHNGAQPHWHNGQSPPNPYVNHPPPHHTHRNSHNNNPHPNNDSLFDIHDETTMQDLAQQWDHHHHQQQQQNRHHPDDAPPVTPDVIALRTADPLIKEWSRPEPNAHKHHPLPNSNGHPDPWANYMTSTEAQMVQNPEELKIRLDQTAPPQPQPPSPEDLQSVAAYLQYTMQDMAAAPPHAFGAYMSVSDGLDYQDGPVIDVEAVHRADEALFIQAATAPTVEQHTAASSAAPFRNANGAVLDPVHTEIPPNLKYDPLHVEDDDIDDNDDNTEEEDILLVDVDYDDDENENDDGLLVDVDYDDDPDNDMDGPTMAELAEAFARMTQETADPNNNHHHPHFPPQMPKVELDYPPPPPPAAVEVNHHNHNGYFYDTNPVDSANGHWGYQVEEDDDEEEEEEDEFDVEEPIEEPPPQYPMSPPPVPEHVMMDHDASNDLDSHPYADDDEPPISPGQILGPTMEELAEAWARMTRDHAGDEGPPTMEDLAEAWARLKLEKNEAAAIAQRQHEAEEQLKEQIQFEIEQEEAAAAARAAAAKRRPPPNINLQDLGDLWTERTRKGPPAGSTSYLDGRASFSTSNGHPYFAERLSDNPRYASNGQAYDFAEERSTSHPWSTDNPSYRNGSHHPAERPLEELVSAWAARSELKSQNHEIFDADRVGRRLTRDHYDGRRPVAPDSPL